MDNGTLVLDPAFTIAEVPRRLFGSFVEHLGRSVYTGIYEPAHATADHDGFRRDVLALVAELGVTTVRYPGGNFVSGYRWEDGVGPREQRPVRLDTAWHSIEDNAVGLGEFMRWARRADLEPMLALNLGTRGLADALDLLEYANHPSGTTLSDLRIAHGAAEPYGVRMWCLGNELDGPWQLGHKTADEYGRLAAETARGMRMIDPDLELVACGSSSSAMPTFGEWERTVLEHAYDCVDYISLHAYYEERDGDLASFLASPVDMDRFIDAVVATADGVRARGRHRKRMALSFDEWNVWYQSRWAEAQPTDWERAPRLLEDVYSVADAVVVGGLLITLLRHADRVTAACLAQLVNVIAPIRTEPGGAAWRQTTFYPFAYTARLAKGRVLRAEPRGPRVETTRFGDVPALDTVATYDDDAGQLVLFATNRDTQKTIGLEVDVTAFPDATVTQALTLGGHEIRATNSIEDPERVTPRPLTAGVTDGALTAILSPASWSVLRLAT